MDPTELTEIPSHRWCLEHWAVWSNGSEACAVAAIATEFEAKGACIGAALYVESPDP